MSSSDQPLVDVLAWAEGTGPAPVAAPSEVAEGALDGTGDDDGAGLLLPELLELPVPEVVDPLFAVVPPLVAAGDGVPAPATGAGDALRRRWRRSRGRGRTSRHHLWAGCRERLQDVRLDTLQPGHDLRVAELGRSAVSWSNCFST